MLLVRMRTVRRCSESKKEKKEEKIDLICMIILVFLSCNPHSFRHVPLDFFVWILELWEIRMIGDVASSSPFISVNDRD